MPRSTPVTVRRRRFVSSVLLSGVMALTGCAQSPNSGHGDIRDYLFGRRHQDLLPRTPEDSVLALAREVTVLEDEMRREGTITIKQPDVWGDGNMVHYIQEHDRLLADGVKKFDETVQALLARSDQAELQASASMAQGLGGEKPPAAPSATLIDIKSDKAFEPLTTLFGKPTRPTIGLEPTELTRQHSTFIHVNQALRRRNSGDDNSRTAGYGLYKFRIPVSVLPGRETSEGWCGVVNLRARLEVDSANLKHTFPKLVVADVVESLAPLIEADWHKPVTPNPVQQMEKLLSPFRDDPEAVECLLALGTARETPGVGSRKVLIKALDDAIKALVCESGNKKPALTSALVQSRVIADSLPSTGTQAQAGLSTQALATPTTIAAKGNIYGDSVEALRLAAKSHFERLSEKPIQPASMELRSFLFEYLGQAYQIIEKRDLLQQQVSLLDHIAAKIERGEPLASDEGKLRDMWLSAFTVTLAGDDQLPSVTWLLAVQSALQDRNLKRMIMESRQRHGDLSQIEGEESSVRFYAPEIAPELTLSLWRGIIESEFPLYVFTLDPQVEEQNVYDAFSRRREMQIALAHALATGKMNANKSLSYSRQLTLDQETIALNRTVVGFNHGRDTFGWYFHPRVQSPPTESTNIGALARMVWSTGPTEHYDLKHRQLEPGIRECEVIVVMPSFVNQVAFDVTSNWERIPHPGKSKRSYEEMVAQGGRLHRVQCQLRELMDEQCFRPGDSARLVSRVEQLEQMLGMQTHVVRVPYEYEQTGTDLFDKGDVQLRPVVHNFYGLQYVQTGDSVEAHFFVAGKHFHPTLTHAILGGSESHSIGSDPGVEVISREVLKVKISKLNEKLSPDGLFDLRIATPSGISNVVVIPGKPAATEPPKEKPAKSAFDWKTAPTYTAWMEPRGDAVQLHIEGISPSDRLAINNQSTLPVDRRSPAKLLVRLVATTADDKKAPLGIEIADVPVAVSASGAMEIQLGGPNGLATLIEAAVADPGRGVKATQKIKSLEGTAWIKFDAWPFEKFDSPISITILPNQFAPPTP
ncbi:MAG: hypothetical protein U1A77_24280 [Pirellulales bacterium]